MAERGLCEECEGTGWACQPPRCEHPLHVQCPWCHGSGKATDPQVIADLQDALVAIQDLALQRNRIARTLGDHNPRTKITDADVRAIRAAAAAGSTYAEIARTYGINKVYVGQLVRRQRRAHV